jgi:hypothetical protein
MSDDSDDDAPPVASSLSSSRAAHLAREAAAPKSKKAIREGERAATKKRQSVVTKGLRGDDYLPDEILSQLPSGPTIGQARRAADAAGADEQRSKKKQKNAAAASGARQQQSKAPPAPDGLPRVVKKSTTVEVAVLPSDPSGVRLHAPVRADVADFMQQQLYGGDRHKRVPAATLSSLKASGGRFGAASNFATVPAAPPPPGGFGSKRKKKRKAASGGDATGSFSTLERMAAKIMRKGK